MASAESLRGNYRETLRSFLHTHHPRIGEPSGATRSGECCFGRKTGRFAGVAGNVVMVANLGPDAS